MRRLLVRVALVSALDRAVDVTSWSIIEGDCRAAMRTFDVGSVQTCVTSPPYFGLRDYGHDGQIGLEARPDVYVQALVNVFREVRRVLADDGTVWLNLGDSYAREPAKGGSGTPNGRNVPKMGYTGAKPVPDGMKPKDLIGVPWMVAFALRADGWYLRRDVIWAKPNPMPESVTDRPTTAHEYLFLLAKSARYFYDADAIREAPAPATIADNRVPFSRPSNGNERSAEVGHPLPTPDAGRNKRSVWTVPSQPYPGAHFATFPPKLIEPCILAGSREGDTVLDPFAGAGTTGMVALRHGRSFVGCELNPDYVRLARDRIIADAPLFNTGSEAVA